MSIMPDDRPFVERQCANRHCIVMFKPKRDNHIYCSEACFCEGEGFPYDGHPDVEDYPRGY